MSWIVEQPIAHRGLHQGDVVPENSLAAFEKAATSSIPIELDVHLLAYGHLAVFHDDDLSRMTGKQGIVWNETSQSIVELRLFDTDQRIPLLEEVLDLVGDRVPILVDIKNKRQIGPLESTLLRALQVSGCRDAVESFNPFSLRWFRLNAPEVTRGQLSGDFRDSNIPGYQKFVLSRYYLNFLSKPHFVAYDIRCLPNRHATRERRNRKIPLIAWTVDTAEKLREARKLVDNIIFENIIP